MVKLSISELKVFISTCSDGKREKRKKDFS